MNKSIIIGILLFTLGQALIWYQTNSQFFNEWAKARPWVMACMGLPISYILIYASKHTAEGFEGLLWPTKFVGFATGVVVMGIFTWIHLGEGVNIKTGVTLLLSFLIMGVQLFWK